MFDERRGPTISTADMDPIMMMVDPRLVRDRGAVPDEMKMVLSDLILGKPVARREARRWGIGVMKICEIDEVVAELAGEVDPQLPLALR